MELLRSQMADKTARRGFAEGLQRPGHAARMRENVSQALRESVMQSRPKLVEPVDYETFVVKNKVLLHNDPQRDMLNFPHDDVEVPPPAPTRLIRTTVSTVPANVNQEVTNLLVKECLKTYTSELQTVKFKYQAYAGSYQQLPNSTRKEPLQEHIFEIDAEVEDKDDDTISRGFSSSITKRGWLLKGPDSGKDNIISFTRQFKRRYFELKQQSDDTYVLSIYKDEKRSDSKGAIFLDLALEAVKNPKKGKYCFEIRMTSDRPPCLLAADNESEVNDWIITLNKVISAADTASQASRDSIKEESITAGAQENYKESQINHPVVKEISLDLSTDSSESLTDTADPPAVPPRRPPPPPPPSSIATSPFSHLPQAPASVPSLKIEVTSADSDAAEEASEFKKPIGVPKVIRRKKKGVKPAEA